MIASNAVPVSCGGTIPATSHIPGVESSVTESKAPAFVPRHKPQPHGPEQLGQKRAQYHQQMQGQQ